MKNELMRQFNISETLVGKVYFYGVIALISMLLGVLIAVNYHIFILLVFIGLGAIFLFYFDSKYSYIVFFVMLICVPTWVNSYSLFGIRFGILTINYPLVFLCVFFIRDIIDIYTKKTAPDINYIDVLVGFLFLWTLFSLSKSVSPEGKRSFYLFGFPLLYFLFAKYCPLDRRDFLAWMKVIILFCLPMAFYLVFELITEINVFFPPQERYKYFSYMYKDSGGYQPGGSFLGPNGAGLFLSMAVAMSLYFYNTCAGKLKKWWTLIIIVLSSGVAITLSRSAWLSLLSVYIMNGFFNKKDRIKLFYYIFTFFVCFAIGFQFFDLPRAVSERLLDSDTINARGEIFYDALNQIKDNWLYGIGYDNFRFRHFWMVKGPTHNVFTSLLVELGIIGLIPFAIVLIVIFYRWKLYADVKFRDRNMLTMFISVFVAYIVTGMAHSVNLAYHSSSLFWIFAAVYLSNRKILITGCDEDTPDK
ncbi:MAG: O-antigen ligase family protein [bacterium]|nr:O-antigen ligase family protein [bacterium]